MEQISVAARRKEGFFFMQINQVMTLFVLDQERWRFCIGIQLYVTTSGNGVFGDFLYVIRINFVFLSAVKYVELLT